MFCKFLLIAKIFILKVDLSQCYNFSVGELKTSKQQQQQQQQQQQVKPQLELDWIRGENEKLLLEMERLQTKMADKTRQCVQMREQLASREAEWRSFVNKCDRNALSNADVVDSQRRVLALEEQVRACRDEHMQTIDANEERQNDLLKRNDQLWLQLTQLETSYNEALDVLRERTRSLEVAEARRAESDAHSLSAQSERDAERALKEAAEAKVSQLQHQLDECKRMREASEARESELLAEKSVLGERVETLERAERAFRAEIESLGKEKAFIVGQSVVTHEKLLSDLLSLQDKQTSASCQLETARAECEQMRAALGDKQARVAQLEASAAQLSAQLKRETDEKLDGLERIKTLNYQVIQLNESVLDTTERLNRTEAHKLKLDAKCKEVRLCLI